MKSYEIEFLKNLYQAVLELSDRRYCNLWNYAIYRRRLANALQADLFAAEESKVAEIVN